MRKIIRFAALLTALALFALPVQAAPEGPLEGMIYEVFVRAFADSDGDGIGDLKGLTGKLDYVESLGAKALWLMPVFPSPSYHGYDVTDYRSINPEYGTMEDFELLLSEAHARGIRVLLDLPINHTSSQHPWFIESRKEDSPYRSWYHWLKAGENDALLGQKVWDNKPWKQLGDAYYYALFWDGMPDLNFSSPEVVREVTDIAKYWLSLGVDGFRMDAASHIFARAEQGMSQDVEASAAFWQGFYREIKAVFPDAYLLAEAWESLDIRSRILTGFDAVVNFDVGDQLIPLIKQGGSGAAFTQALARVYGAYEQAAPGRGDAPFLSNHDQPRVFAALGYSKDRAALAARVLMTLPGNPVVYYGEEIGMAGAKPDEELRTPMLWGEGDSALTTWHDSRYNKRTQSVSLQQEDADSLLSVYRRMAALRQAHPALLRGSFAPYEASDSALMAWTRTAEGETILVVHNPTGEARAFEAPEGALNLSDEASAAGGLSVPALSSLLLRLPMEGI